MRAYRVGVQLVIAALGPSLMTTSLVAPAGCWMPRCAPATRLSQRAEIFRFEGMGTTLTATILFAGNRPGLVHISDSRGYLLRDGELTQITATTRLSKRRRRRPDHPGGGAQPPATPVGSCGRYPGCRTDADHARSPRQIVTQLGRVVRSG